MTRILLVALAALVALAGNASALYMQTPLLLEAPEQAESGDTLTIVVRGFNETEAAAYAGATVRVLYTYNIHEQNETGPDPNATMEAEYVTVVILEQLVLDENAEASFEWTVPAEVDDRNVDLFLAQDGSEERLAFAFLAVGDAVPMMHIMAATGPTEPDLEGEAGPTDGGAANDGDEQTEDEAGADAPGLGLLAALVGIGAVALLVRRR